MGNQFNHLIIIKSNQFDFINDAQNLGNFRILLRVTEIYGNMRMLEFGLFHKILMYINTSEFYLQELQLILQELKHQRMNHLWKCQWTSLFKRTLLESLYNEELFLYYE